MPRMIDADKLIDDYNKSDGTISDLMELILDAAEEAPPPNDPLTLDELREMDGMPVWIEEGSCAHYVLITDVLDVALWAICREDESKMLFKDYGKTWTAYRRKPEERTK